MTVRDKGTEFSSAQAITTASTYVSTNVVDTQAPGGDVGVGEELRVSFIVEEAFVGGTNVTVQLFTSDVENFGSEVKIFDSGAIATANLGKGAEIKAKLPFGCKRYLRAKYVSTGTYSAGKITGGIVKEVDNWKAANPVGVTY